ncbi:MAG: DUF4432 family protein [Caldilineaceae bacterium]
MTTIHLSPSMFGAKEQTLIEHGPFTVTTWQWDNGVCGLRMRNERGSLVMLPFQGQQIWSAEFDGRDITMKSMFDGPRKTQEYLLNYGGFLLHCGFMAMGVPTPEDNHALHGELPNAPYGKASIVLGADERGEFIALTGAYNHTVAFSTNYLAEPTVKLYAGSSRFRILFKATNLKVTPMEYMYMAHVNFRPVDNGRLVYSAPADKEHVRLRESIPPHVKPTPAYLAFMDELREHPERHHVLSPDKSFDPEIVFNIDFKADNQGWRAACSSTRTAAPTTLPIGPTSSTWACAGSAVCRIRTPSALCCPPLPVPKAILPKSKKASCASCPARPLFRAKWKPAC